MAEQEIDIRKGIDASPHELFRLIGDSSSWPDWAPIDSCELERAGDGDGPGEVRIFSTGRYTVREEIVERDPDRRLAYILLSGLPLRDYRAQIDVTPAGSGSEVRWHTTFRPKIPGTGRLLRRAVAKATQQFVDGLATNTG